MQLSADRPLRPLRGAALAVLAAATLAGCGSFNDATQRMASAFTPYKIEIVQGNFVSREQVEALQPGMSRHQVRDILGTPLIASVFHADRWDYAFTLRRQGVEPQMRKLAVFFRGDQLERVEGDPMPSEAEFVATLDNKRGSGRVPPLEATEEQLRAFSAKSSKAAEAASPAPATAPAPSYPPLEPPTR